MFIITDIPTNVNHELYFPSQCNASNKNMAKSGFKRNLLALKSKSSLTSYNSLLEKYLQGQ